MYTKKIPLYLVANTNTDIKETVTFIKNAHRNVRQVQILSAQAVFTTDKAFANLVQQYEGKRTLIVEKNKVSTVAIKLATATKIQFGLIVGTGNTTRITYINKVNTTNNVKTTKRIAVGTVNN